VGSDHRFTDVDILRTYGRKLDVGSPGAPAVIGRASQIDALARAIGDKRSAVLLGPARVGKTAIVWGLARMLKAGKVPGLKKGTIWEMGSGGLGADTSYVGELESKIRRLLEGITPKKVMWVPDLWNLPTTGTHDRNPRGAYDLLRPAVEAGKLVLIGEMTEERWQGLTRTWPNLEADFTPIAVPETDDEETQQILGAFVKQGGLPARFDPSAIDRVRTLSRRFQPTRAFPGKGIDLLRSVSADVKAAAPEGTRPNVDAAGVERAFSAQTGLPLHMISPTVRVTWEEMQGFLDQRVLGQSEAVGAVTDVLALYKTGLRNPDRPAGVLLFVGPTGVGKTELAKATAEFLFGSPDRLFRIDMSEYKDFHSFEKLIGDPRANRPGLLTNHVRKNPFTVILLDEFEKGSANLADLFLQVFDDGRLTDSAGETVDFRHTIIILTSNVGSELFAAGSQVGFGGEQDGAVVGASASRVRRALEGAYRPEFLNRLDRILVFSPLGREHMRQIAQREIGRLYTREGLLERDLLLEVDDGVIDLLVERGFDPKYGARPLKRAVDTHLVLALARALLSAEWQRFQLVRVARKGDRIDVSFDDTPAARRLRHMERQEAVQDGAGGKVRLSLAEVRDGMAGLLDRLSTLWRDADADGKRERLAELDRMQQTQGRWEDLLGQDGLLSQQHQLRLDLRRLDDLSGRAEAVRELVEGSFQEADDSVAKDLLREYVYLTRSVGRAERELGRFEERDRDDARLRIRPAAGNPAAKGWVGQLADMYSAWAKRRGAPVQRFEAGNTIELVIGGDFAFGYLRGERGGHRLLRKGPKVRGRGVDKPETLLARVEVWPDSEAPPNDEHGDDVSPFRLYDQLGTRTVTDKRADHSEPDVSKVLQGRIDRLLAAAADARAR